VSGTAAVVLPGTPLRLALDLSKPVLAGVLTIRDPAGTVVASLPSPASPDGSLRSLVWDPGTAAPGTYSWTLQATDQLDQAVRATAGGGPATGTFTVGGCVSFEDVPVTHQFHDPICWAGATGVTYGSGDGSQFAPSNPVNRGSMAAFLYRLAGSPAWQAPAVSPFADVPVSHQFYQAITWLEDQGITVGVTLGDTTYYQPGNAVNRGSMAAFLKRLSGNPAWPAPAVSPFADVARGHTFYAPITWLADQGITQGVVIGGLMSYAPGSPVNRGAMAAFLSRLARAGLYCQEYQAGVGCG
jgi:hypothetical protein